MLCKTFIDKLVTWSLKNSALSESRLRFSRNGVAGIQGCCVATSVFTITTIRYSCPVASWARYRFITFFPHLAECFYVNHSLMAFWTNHNNTLLVSAANPATLSLIYLGSNSFTLSNSGLNFVTNMENKAYLKVNVISAVKN